MVSSLVEDQAMAIHGCWCWLADIEVNTYSGGKAFDKYVAPALLMGYIGFLFLLTKISRNKELQKNYMQALVVVTIALVAGAVLSKHKKDVSL